MRELKQSTAANVMVFLTDSTDHVTGKAGLTLTITASKDGAAFASITPTVTERGSGWYSLALTTTHTNTLGDFALHITGTGADPADLAMRIIAMDKSVANTPANATQFAGATVASDFASAVRTAADQTATIHTNTNSLVRYIRVGTSNVTNDTVPTTTQFTIDDPANGLEDIGDPLLIFDDPSMLYNHGGSIIESYAFDEMTSKVLITLAEPLPIAPEVGDPVVILRAHIYPIARIADGVLAAGDIDGYTLEQSQKIHLAALAGKLSGAATETNVIRAADDSKPRITATVDNSGNRTAITLDATG